MTIADGESERSSHYDAAYYDWQRRIGEFGGWANARKFAATVGADDVVLDFGCGGGFLLERFVCRRRIGIEPNPAAASSIAAKGIEHHPSSAAALAVLGEGAVDTIVSNHALEHTIEPARELRNLLRLLRPGGTIHFVVPCENVTMRYRPDDRDRHLYSWGPSCLGNLFDEIGFRVEYARPLVHKWPPGYRHIAKLGWPVFDAVCRVYGQLRRSWFQVEVRATRPLQPL